MCMVCAKEEIEWFKEEEGVDIVSIAGTIEARALKKGIDAIYERKASGGAWHAVLDDYNTDMAISDGGTMRSLEWLIDNLEYFDDQEVLDAINFGKTLKEVWKAHGKNGWRKYLVAALIDYDNYWPEEV